MGWIVPLLFFKMGDFGTEKPTKFDTPLNKVTKPYHIKK